jgi:long-chain acyl-CoA synthetase
MSTAAYHDRLPTHLRRVLQTSSNRTGLIFEEREYPWSYLQEGVDALDELLDSAGMSDAHSVGILLRNRPAQFAALVAITATGRQVVTLSPHYGDIALADDIRALRPQVVIADEDDWTRLPLAEAVAEIGAVPLLVGDHDRPLTAHRGGWPIAVEHSAPDGTAVLMQTSGTTGTPKRVALGFDELAAAFEASGTPLSDNDIRIRSSPSILWASLVHISGLYFALANVAAGLPTALLERFDVDRWAALMRRCKPRRVGLAPAAIRMVLHSDLPADVFDGVDYVRAGTAPLDPAEADRFTARFGVPVLGVYGATEFAGAIAGWTLDLHRRWGGEKRGSAGKPFAGVELRVTDDEGSPVAAGVVGVLEACGPQLPSRGWIRTTDLASIDNDGFLFIHGRSDEAINRGGFKIVPSVIEDALLQHPAVSDAAAVGIPDDRLGEVPVAAVTLAEGSPTPELEELHAWLAEHLARYHLPTQIRIFGELPRTPSLKVSRPQLRALFADDERA